MDSRLEKLKENLESAVEGMSSEQLSWHPPGKWCAVEVLEHLYLTYSGTITGFEAPHACADGTVYVFSGVTAPDDIDGAAPDPDARAGVGARGVDRPAREDHRGERRVGPAVEGEVDVHAEELATPRYHLR